VPCFTNLYCKIHSCSWDKNFIWS